MRRFLLAAVALGWAAAASALNTSTVYAFATVDSVKMDGYYLVVRGIRSGEATVSELPVNFYAGTDAVASMQRLRACVQLATVAMSKPGQYVLELQGQTTSGNLPTCALVRANP